MFSINPFSMKWKCRRNGKIDGKRGIPLIDQEDISKFEEGLIAKANEKLSRIAKNKDKENKALSKKSIYFKKMIELHEEQLGDIDKEPSSIKQKFEQSKEEFNNLEHISRNIWFWTIFTIIGIAEFPLNSHAFRQFGMTDYETYIMTTTLCLAIPLSAHFLGKFLNEKNIRITHIHAYISFISIFVLIFVLVGIAYLRGKFLIENITGEMNYSVTLGPWIICTFFFINTLIYLVVTWASYLMHKTYPENYQDIKQDIKSKTLKFKKTKKEYSKIKKKREKIEKTRLKFRNKLNDTESCIEARKQHLYPSSKENEILERNKILKAIYENYNNRMRNKENVPTSFKRTLSFISYNSRYEIMSSFKLNEDQNQ